MNIDTPIQSQTSSLLRTFYILLNFLQHPPPNAYTPPESHISHTSIADELGRFKVWAGNIGALQKGPSSLDWRLREASHVTGPILRLLRDLEGGLKEATAILSGQRLPRDLLSSSDEDSDDSTPSVYSEGSSAFGSDNASTSQSQSMSRSSSQSSFAPRRPRRSSSLNSNAPLSELHQLQLGIQQTITHLFRLSILIRRATPRDRYKKKADLLPAYSSTFDIAHVREKFPRACEQSGLVERLGKANTKRRMYLKYREQHAMKLRRELRKVEEAEEAARQQALRPQDDDDDEEEEVEEVEEAPTLRVPQSVQARSVGQGTEATSAVMTTASTFLAEEYKADEEVEDEGSVGAESQTSFATSTAEDGAGGLKVPACPGDHGGEFECPYCWSIQVCRGRVAWKKHVFADLEPYICTHPNCHTPPFPTRSSWSTHELTTHRLEYHCTLHDRTFATSSALESHLLKHHTPTPTKLQLPLLVEKCQRPMTKFSPDDCPLCTTWGTRIRALEEKTRFVKEGEKLVVTARVFMRHLGRHMEQLALFALPRVTEGEEGSWDSDKPEFEGGSEGGSAVSDDGSEEDDKEQEVVETRKRRYESILPVVLEPYEGLEEEERQKLMENRYYLYAIEPLKTAAMVLDAALDPTIDINAKDEESKTLLMRAITDPGSDYQFAMTMVALLLRRGADVKSHDKYGWNARQASKEYWGEVLNQLLDDHEAGKDVLYGRPEDELIDAVRKRLELYKQSEEVLRLSILSGDFSSRLIEAVEGKNEWLVRRLLMCGGDPEYKTEDGQSPVQLARMVEGLMDGESKTPFGGKSMFGGITQILFKAISGKTGRPIEELEKEYSSGTWAFGETEDGPKPAELRQLRPDSDDEASERGEEEGQPETDAGALTDAGEQLPQDLAPVEHGNEVSVQSDKLGAFAGNRYYSSRCNVPGCDKAVGPSERRYKCRICVDVDHCADCYEKGHVVCRATGREHSLIPILRTGPALFGTAATDLIFPVKLLQIGRWTCSADEHKLVVRFSSTTNCITYHFIMSRNIYMMEMPLSSITWLIGPFEKGSFDNSVSPHPALYIGSVRTGELVPVQDPAATRRKLGLPDGPSHSLVPEGGDSAALQAEIDRLQATRAWKIRAMPTKCDCCSSPFGNSIWYRCSMDTCPKNVFCTLCIRRAESKFGHAKDHQFICFMGLEEENVLKEREMQAARLVAEEEEAKRSRETVEAAVEIGTEIGKLREQGEAHDQVAEEKLPDTLESSAQQEMGDPYSADRLPLPNISQLISRNGISLGDLEQVKDVQTDTLDAPVDEDMSDSSSATSDDDLPEAKITSCSPLHNDAWVDKDGVWTAVAVPEDDPFFRHCKGCKAPLKSDSKRHKCVICPDSNLCGNCFSSGKTCSVSQPERHPRCFITILRTARARKPLAECKDCGAKDYYGMWYGLYQSNSASAPAPAHPVAQATPAPEQTLHSNSTSVATPSSGETLQGPTTEAADEQSPASNPSWNFETLFSNPRAINTMSTDSQNVRKDEKEEPSSCSTCNKTFSRGRDRRRHEDQIHGKKVAAVCKLSATNQCGCNKAFKRVEHLKSHLKTVAKRRAAEERLREDNLSITGHCSSCIRKIIYSGTHNRSDRFTCIVSAPFKETSQDMELLASQQLVSFRSGLRAQNRSADIDCAGCNTPITLPSDRFRYKCTTCGNKNLCRLCHSEEFVCFEGQTEPHPFIAIGKTEQRMLRFRKSINKGPLTDTCTHCDVPLGTGFWYTCSKDGCVQAGVDYCGKCIRAVAVGEGHSKEHRYDCYYDCLLDAILDEEASPRIFEFEPTEERSVPVEQLGSADHKEEKFEQSGAEDVTNVQQASSPTIVEAVVGEAGQKATDSSTTRKTEQDDEPTELVRSESDREFLATLARSLHISMDLTKIRGIKKEAVTELRRDFRFSSITEKLFTIKETIKLLSLGRAFDASGVSKQRPVSFEPQSSTAANSSKVLLRAVASDIKPAVVLLLKAGAGLSQIDGVSPVELAIRNGGYSSFTAFILQKYSDGFEFSASWDTLMDRLEKEHTSLSEAIMSLLRVAHDGDINAIDADTGRSPLHSAAWEGNDVLVKALLEQGANPNLKSRNGRTALELVRGKRQTLMRDMLVNYRAVRDGSYKKPDHEEFWSEDVQLYATYKPDLEDAWKEDSPHYTTRKRDGKGKRPESLQVPLESSSNPHINLLLNAMPSLDPSAVEVKPDNVENTIAFRCSNAVCASPEIKYPDIRHKCLTCVGSSQCHSCFLSGALCPNSETTENSESHSFIDILFTESTPHISFMNCSGCTTPIDKELRYECVVSTCKRNFCGRCIRVATTKYQHPSSHNQFFCLQISVPTWTNAREAKEFASAQSQEEPPTPSQKTAIPIAVTQAYHKFNRHGGNCIVCSSFYASTDRVPCEIGYAISQPIRAFFKRQQSILQRDLGPEGLRTAEELIIDDAAGPAYALVKMLNDQMRKGEIGSPKSSVIGGYTEKPTKLSVETRGHRRTGSRSRPTSADFSATSPYTGSPPKEFTEPQDNIEPVHLPAPEPTSSSKVRDAQKEVEAVIELLRAGRNIDARDEQGRTMLARCAASGNEMAVNRLLDNGANPHIPDFSNKTPLDHAAAAGHSNIIYFLSRKAQNLESVKESLHMATEEVDRKRTHQKLYSSIDELRREGIDIDERDAGGATLLARLASQGNMASVKRMLQRGADCTITNGHGHLPVDLAREAGNTQIVKLLEDHYEEMKRRRKKQIKATIPQLKDALIDGLITRREQVGESSESENFDLLDNMHPIEVKGQTSDEQIAVGALIHGLDTMKLSQEAPVYAEIDGLYSFYQENHYPFNIPSMMTPAEKPDSKPNKKIKRPLELFGEGDLNLQAVSDKLHERNGVALQDRMWKSKLYQNCFVGSEMVDWMLENFANVKTREEAETLGTVLMEGGLFCSIEGRLLFRDGNFFYQILLPPTEEAPADADDSPFSQETSPLSEEALAAAIEEAPAMQRTTSSRSIRAFDHTREARRLYGVLTQTRAHSRSQLQPLIDILPRLSSADIKLLTAEYLKIKPSLPRDPAYHIKQNLSGSLREIAYACALGPYKSEYLWASAFFNSPVKPGAPSPLLMEALVGKSCYEINKIQKAASATTGGGATSLKVFEGDLQKQIIWELKPDTYRSALLSSLDTDKRMQDDESSFRDKVTKDVTRLFEAIADGKAGRGEAALCDVLVRANEEHLRGIVESYQLIYGVDLAETVKENFKGPFGECMVYLLSGVLNKPLRDAQLIHNALGLSSRNDSVGEGSSATGEVKDRLLTARLVRAHWDREHFRRMCKSYEDCYGKRLEGRIGAILKQGAYRDFILEMFRMAA